MKDLQLLLQSKLLETKEYLESPQFEFFLDGMAASLNLELYLTENRKLRFMIQSDSQRLRNIGKVALLSLALRDGIIKKGSLGAALGAYFGPKGTALGFTALSAWEISSFMMAAYEASLKKPLPA